MSTVPLVWLPGLRLSSGSGGDLVSPIFRHFPEPCRGPNSGSPRPVNMAFTPCLYALLLLQPLTGLAQSLARGRSFMLFEWQVPKVMAGKKVLTLLFHQIHTVSAWLLLGLIGLHVLAALFHRLVLKDEVLQSMLPWRSTHAAGDAPTLLSLPRMHRHVPIRHPAKQR